MKNIIISDRIEFPTIERFDVNSEVSTITDYIQVWFSKEGQQKENFMYIVSDEFKSWLRDQPEYFKYWDFRRLFAAENRVYLRGYITNYIRKEIFQNDITEEQRVDYLMEEVANVRQELAIAQLAINQKDKEIEFLKNQHIKKAS